MSGEIDIAQLQEWVGRQETRADVVSEQLVSAYRATLLDNVEPVLAGELAPAGIHWCLAQHTAPMHALGPDGHPARGGFLPPVPLPRRMWAGSRIRFGAELRVGDRIERTSTVADVSLKAGASGQLCFVTVEHVFRSDRGEAVREEQDLVYREPAPSRKTGTAAEGERARPGTELGQPERTRSLEASPVLLFRYSALTFNGHRIHYDYRYATETENYPGLVVHGPLQAALLLALAEEMRSEPPRRFEFRARRALFDSEPIVLNGLWRDAEVLDLWTGAPGQAPHVSATASW